MRKEIIDRGINGTIFFTNFNLTALFVLSLYFLNINKCYSQDFTSTAPSFKVINSNYTAVLKGNISNDSDKTKHDSIIVSKTDTNKSIVKDKKAKNSITMQPFGFLFLISNIEYDRYISKDFSAGIKIEFTTFLLRKVFENSLDEKDKLILNSLKSVGFGAHIRYYTGGRSIEGFYLSFDVDVIFISYDEQEDKDSINYIIPPFPPPPPSSSTPVIYHKKGTLWRTMFEIGNKFKLSSSKYGVVIDWSFGAGGGFLIYENKVRAVPLISIGFGIGYSF